MKVLFVTDVHRSEDALSWVARNGGLYEALIVGGDLARSGPQDFVPRFLGAALSTSRRVLYVHGNADSLAAEVPEGVETLHGKVTEMAGLKVGGLGGSNPTPFKTVFELEDAKAREVLRRLGAVDVLVSHCPPANTKCDRTLGGHIGSVPVREYVDRVKPALVLSGHVHESRAVDNVGGTTVVNPGPLMEGKFAEVSLGSVVSVELKDADLMS